MSLDKYMQLENILKEEQRDISSLANYLYSLYKGILFNEEIENFVVELDELLNEEKSTSEKLKDKIIRPANFLGFINFLPSVAFVAYSHGWTDQEIVQVFIKVLNFIYIPKDK